VGALKSIAVAVLLVMACSRSTVDRAEWKRMSPSDRVLYVKSLIGAEQAQAAKGGATAQHQRAAEEYTTMIDQAYARGDEREVHEVFAGLAP
jgi:hypothetical protein